MQKGSKNSEVNVRKGFHKSVLNHNRFIAVKELEFRYWSITLGFILILLKVGGFFVLIVNGYESALWPYSFLFLSNKKRLRNLKKMAST